MSTATRAEILDLDDASYHAERKSVSRSMLEVFLDDPALYRARFLDETLPGETTTATEIGSAFHAAMADFATAKVAVIPQDVLSKSGAKAGQAWLDWKAEHEGEIVLKADEWAIVDAMKRSVYGHSKAAALLRTQSIVEQGIRWWSHPSGLYQKCKPDRRGRSFIVDFKTAREVHPQGFASAAARMGYHRQAAFYQDGVEALTGERLPFVFIIVQNQPPYSCEVFDLDAEFVELGRRQNDEALHRLARCYQDGNWRSPTHGTIVTLSAPNWLKYESEWSYGDC